MERSAPVHADERARRAIGPAVCGLASLLLLCCLLTLPDVTAHWALLGIGGGAPTGWAAIGVGAAIGTAAVTLGLAARLGAGPPLALGAVSAVLGLLLTGDVTSRGQVGLGLVVMGVAVGGLFAGGLLAAEGLPERWCTAGRLCWLLPLAGGWGLVAVLAVRDQDPTRVSLGLHPPGPVLALGAGAILAWALLDILVDRQPRSRFSAPEWELAWTALGTLVAAALGVVMLIGFPSSFPPSWGRPLVLLAAVLVVLGFAGCAWAMPVAQTRAACVGAVTALGTGPSCIAVVVVVAAGGSGAVAWWMGPALAVVGVGAGLLGWRGGRAATVGGLVLLAAACAGAWVLPAGDGWALLAAGGLVAGTAATVCGTVADAADVADRRPAVGFVSVAGLSALLLGLLAAAPLGWALGAPILDSVVGAGADVRAGGRVLLGLTFAVSVLAAAVCAVLPTVSDRNEKA